MKQYGLINGGYGVQKNLTLGFNIPAINLSSQAKIKLRWIDYYNKHKNVSLTCRYFGISRKTLYKWLKRYNPTYLQSLEEKSRKPHKLRISENYFKFKGKIKELRSKYPTWSKYKIGAVLRQENIQISDSAVGSILKRLGLYNKKLSRKRQNARRRNTGKIRIKDVEIRLNKPGALLQVDTKEFNSVGDKKLIQFTAIDCFSRIRKLRGYRNKSAFNGREFLRYIIKNMEFKIEAILTDNGSEFMAEFDDECRKLNIKHYWTTPESPNQNAYVESSHCIDQKEFYETRFIPLGVVGFNQALKKWEYEYNFIRPHGSLKFVSPETFLKSVKIAKS